MTLVLSVMFQYYLQEEHSDVKYINKNTEESK